MVGMGGVLELNANQPAPICLDMTLDQVVAKLGKPDRRAILEGKLLRTLTMDDSEVDLLQNRLVFIYDQTKVQVWFKNGRVTGMTKSGIAVLRGKTPTHDK